MLSRVSETQKLALARWKWSLWRQQIGLNMLENEPDVVKNWKNSMLSRLSECLKIALACWRGTWKVSKNGLSMLEKSFGWPGPPRYFTSSHPIIHIIHWPYLFFASMASERGWVGWCNYSIFCLSFFESPLLFLLNLFRPPPFSVFLFLSLSLSLLLLSFFLVFFLFLVFVSCFVFVSSLLLFHEKNNIKRFNCNLFS